jgi:hypothetical protein
LIEEVANTAGIDNYSLMSRKIKRRRRRRNSNFYASLSKFVLRNQNHILYIIVMWRDI